MEKESGGIRGYLGSIWEASGKHLDASGSSWDAPGYPGSQGGVLGKKDVKSSVFYFVLALIFKLMST